ncbi:formylglycine-generating enzyme family protein [Francisellaceae bacterium]|nr:formylglycine-generating enzyme family protein [Francisellaceae bacterium]
MKKLVIIFGLVINSISYAKLTCEHHYTDEIWGSKVEVCYAKNYTDYTPKQAAEEFLKDQVYVAGGEFKLDIEPPATVAMKGFYMGKYLVPYQEYNAYLKATGQWNDGFVKGEGKARLRRDIYNGLYPAKATYDSAQGFCKWMGKLTDLDVTLPQYGQWLYAATSRGKNWAYPTDNNKLELGVNFPAIAAPRSLTTAIPVNESPVNSIGIHQIFGNGWQWSMTKLSKNNGGYFKVSGDLGNVIAGGTHYPGPEMTKKLLEGNTLRSSFAVAPDQNSTVDLHFRCIINTEKPLTKAIE